MHDPQQLAHSNTTHTASMSGLRLAGGGAVKVGARRQSSSVTCASRLDQPLRWRACCCLARCAYHTSSTT